MAEQTTAPSYGSLASLVRKAETNFIYGNDHPSKYVWVSPFEDISTIEAYLNSKHISGEKDSFGRDKPFFNIVLASRNIWFRATDLDTKNVKIKPTNSKEVLPAFLATIHLKDWMRRNNFGHFLNNWGLELSGYNSVATKHVEQDGTLKSIVVPWNRFICDFIDFDNNPKIEILEMTQAQLKSHPEYDQEVVTSLLSAVKARENIDKSKKDIKNDYIKLYEVHGKLSLSYLTSKETDNDIFVQQMQVISFIDGKQKGEYQDFSLVKGREEKDPYMITSLMPAADGSVSLMGSVKSLFDSQWMQNHSVKIIKDQLDLASKLIFQTADVNFIGQNALTAIENGDIMIHKENMPLTTIANTSHDITSIQNFAAQWKALSQEITSTPDVLHGKNQPSSAAYGTTTTILGQANDNFYVMTQNKGLALEQMLRLFILPYIKKQLNNKDEIMATLDNYDVKKIAVQYIKSEAVKRTNQALVKAVIAGQQITPQMQADLQKQHEGALQGEFDQNGNRVFFQPSEIDDMTWKEMFKDLEWEVECEITDENEDTQAVMTTLSTVLQTLATNPRVLYDPNAKLVFNKILQATGAISELELQDAAPFITPPAKRLSEVINYKDVPDDIKRQIEVQEGFTPSQNPQNSSVTGANAIPVNGAYPLQIDPQDDASANSPGGGQVEADNSVIAPKVMARKGFKFNKNK